MGSDAQPLSPESQPTQVINNILAGSIHDASASENSTEPFNGLSAERYPAKDMPSDPPSSYHSGPRYRYDDLANTQTNPIDPDGPCKEIPPLKGPQMASRKPLSVKGPQPLTRKGPRSAPGGSTPGSKANPSAIATKLAAGTAQESRFLSQPDTSRGNMQRGRGLPSHRSTPRHRSSSSSSEDSFAGPAVIEDPQKAFLAASKQFDKPLSELGRDSMPDDHLSSPDIASAPIPERGSSPIINSPQSSPHAATVLVESTPSGTDYSQSSQADLVVQPFPSWESPATQGIHFTQPRSQIPSSPLVPTQVASYPSSDREDVVTQPNDFQPTQPMDEDEPTTSNTNAQASTSTGPSGQTSYPPSIGPRSLLRMLPPDKLKQRYPGFQLGPSIRPSDAPSTSEGQTQPSTPVKETPSLVLFQHIIQARSATSRGDEETASHPRPSTEDGIVERDFGIVPDSEPTQLVDDSPPTPKAKLRVVPAPASGTKQRRPSKEARIAPAPPRKEEEEEDDEEDVPLVVASKGKGKAVSGGGDKKRLPGETASKQVDKPAAGKAGPSSRGAKADAAKSAKGTHNSTPTEVPSSVPQQDLHASASSEHAVPSSTPFKSKSAARADTASVHGTPRRNVADILRSDSPLSQTSDDDEVPRTQDPLDLITATKQEEEEGTEPADDIPMDIDEDFVQPGPSSIASRKRKRVPSFRTNTKSMTRASKTPSATPATRSVKRLKQTSTARSSRSDATRVFALYRANNCYYSGTVYSHSDKGPTRFVILFDDGDKEDNIDISKMRRCEPRVGDSVITNEDDMTGKINKGCNGESGTDILEVEIDHGAEIDLVEVRLKDIRIAARAFLSKWKDRTLTIDDIVPIVQPKNSSLPYSPSKSSVLSSASHRKALTKTGFVLTLSKNFNEPEATRTSMEQRIVSNGGQLLKDWTDILQITTKRTTVSKRWVITPQDFKYKPKAGINKVILISDDANQKAKYLVALALGIPCVHLDWLDTLDDDTIDSWCRYLLPAGYSEPLDARVSQLVDMDWGNSNEHLTEILSNSVPTKVFVGKSVLLVGTEYFPLPAKGRRTASNADRSPSSEDGVPRILLCMGAERVEVVPETKSASYDLGKYDYIIVKDESSSVYKNPGDGCCVTMQWVKDCLIASRLLPLPRA
ncbi:hypothetical protein EVG20_g355 [Dentipellis fragilis]|uniref:BRCT domain-containing protein n=1 Tax=Dentipellis fragilis TaxID=205917 RepID=A0A4Y9ZFB6_9AGAM|nr:hypothetical protein EVG20_g355 [Dentipellis fragilis]